MKLLDFLFGKKPPIFNNKGDIQHQLKKNTWSEWVDKYKKSPEYNWRRHSGKFFYDQEKPTNRSS